MGVKIQADEISSIIKERIDNFEMNTDGFDTDAKWRDALESSKTLICCNDRLQSYTEKIIKINPPNKTKLLQEIHSSIRTNESVILETTNLYNFKTHNGTLDVINESDAVNYIQLTTKISNTIELSNKIEQSIKQIIEKGNNNGKK